MTAALQIDARGERMNLVLVQGAEFGPIDAVMTNPDVALTTSALTAANGSVLNFASTTGLAVGMSIAGAGVPTGATVGALSATTVTMSTPSTAGVASGVPITFTGLPVNLTGCTVFGSIRNPATPTLEAALITATITAALTGGYRFRVTAANTNLLPAGQFLESAESQYEWDLFLKDAAGSVLQLYFGSVKVQRRVAKPTP